jgi:uncharacterized protein (DUF302 family)
MIKTPVRRPVRFWMTGCVAIVMAALTSSPARARPELEELRMRTRSALSSPYDVAETVCKIEEAAHARGWLVFAKVQPNEWDTPSATIVLASPEGVTPVLQGEPATGLELPLRIEVTRTQDGRTQVSYHDMQRDERRADMPESAIQSLAPLSEVLEAALA